MLYEPLNMGIFRYVWGADFNCQFHYRGINVEFEWVLQNTVIPLFIQCMSVGQSQTNITPPNVVVWTIPHMMCQETLFHIPWNVLSPYNSLGKWLIENPPSGWLDLFITILLLLRKESHCGASGQWFPTFFICDPLIWSHVFLHTPITCCMPIS